MKQVTFCVNGIQIVWQAVQNYLVLLMADINQSCQMPWNCVITVVLWIHWSKVEFCLHLIRFAQLEKIKNSHSCINHILKHLIHFMRPCYMHLLFLFLLLFWNLTNICSLFLPRHKHCYLRKLERRQALCLINNADPDQREGDAS